MQYKAIQKPMIDTVAVRLLKFDGSGSALCSLLCLSPASGGHVTSTTLAQRVTRSVLLTGHGDASAERNLCPGVSGACMHQ